MILPALLTTLAKPTILRALVASLFVHLSGIGAVAAFQLWRPTAPTAEFAGQQVIVQMAWAPAHAPPVEVSLAQPTPTPAKSQPQQDILRSPRDVKIVERQATVDITRDRAPATDQASVTAPPQPVVQNRRSNEVEQQPEERVQDSPPRRDMAEAPSTAVVAMPPGTVAESPPEFFNNRRPAYPPAAFRSGIEGEVLLSLHVAASGDVTRVDVIRSSGHEMLDRAAVDAVRTWRGRPARRGGVAVAVVQQLPVQFRLRQGN